jgi:hypothetical protein
MPKKLKIRNPKLCLIQSNFITYHFSLLVKSIELHELFFLLVIVV